MADTQSIHIVGRHDRHDGEAYWAVATQDQPSTFGYPFACALLCGFPVVLPDDRSDA